METKIRLEIFVCKKLVNERKTFTLSICKETNGEHVCNTCTTSSRVRIKARASKYLKQLSCERALGMRSNMFFCAYLDENFFN